MSPLWPALGALALVVILSIGMLGVDLALDRHTAQQTAKLVGDSLRSVALADDLRYQAYRLSAANLTPDQIASIAEQIDVDARSYDPLATGAGESVEWERLENLLAHLRHEQPLPTSSASAPLISEIETSIARLVEINQADARKAAREIRDAHHSALAVDGIVGVITLLLAALVGYVLVRSLQRQRQLLRVHLDTIGDRTRELAAFAARTAHDLKAPLSPIRGYADMLTLNPAHEVAEPARRIGRAVDRMASIIDDMLELSVHGKPPAGRVAIAPTVLEVLEELRGELGDAQLVLELGELVAGCSENVLAQALRNVVTNAVKYRAPDRKLVLRIEARKQRDRVAIAIGDNGIGMDGETAAHAFDPLYRAPGASAPGHGLGLAIVKRTIEAAGGSVELASELGTGTHITILLPGG